MASEEGRKKIVETALQMFNSRGCRSTTMDDIASALHMSKRTLYEYFATKEELLEACLMTIHTSIERCHRQAYSKGDEPLLMALYMIKMNTMRNIGHQRLIEDTERYYPELHDRFFKVHTQAFRDMIVRTLQYADRCHYLRSDIDKDTAATFICNMVQQRRLSEVEDKDAYVQNISKICFTYLRGMLNVETIERYEQKEAGFHLIMEQLNRIDNRNIATAK